MLPMAQKGFTHLLYLCVCFHVRVCEVYNLLKAMQLSCEVIYSAVIVAVSLVSFCVVDACGRCTGVPSVDDIVVIGGDEIEQVFSTRNLSPETIRQRSASALLRSRFPVT